MKKMEVIYFCLMVNKQQLNVLSVPKHYLCYMLRWTANSACELFATQFVTIILYLLYASTFVCNYKLYQYNIVENRTGKHIWPYITLPYTFPNDTFYYLYTMIIPLSRRKYIE